MRGFVRIAAAVPTCEVANVQANVEATLSLWRRAHDEAHALVVFPELGLTSYTARMSIKDKVGGTELLSLTTEGLQIIVDNSSKTIKLDLDATETAAITWKKGVYDLELVSPGGVVTALLYGSVSVTPEVTD